MKIKVLFENKNLFVLDKPADFVVHGDGKESTKKQKSISEYILKNHKKLKGVGENLFVEIEGKKIEIQKPGIVHRLDKDTTGALIVAKNQKSFEILKHQFQNHKIKKEYVAIVWGHMKQDTGIIDTPIARSKSDFRKKEIVTMRRGAAVTDILHRGEEREAITRYKVLKRVTVLGQKLSLVTYFPQTGRMHQLRIHTKSIGHPIVGDHLYGPVTGEKEKFEKKFFGKLPVRQLLHARTITFHNPETGDLIKVESPLPKDFREKDLK